MKKLLKSILFVALSVFTLSSCEDVPAPYPTPGAESNKPTELTLTGDGSWANPYTVADALGLIRNGQNSSEEVYIKGIITSVGIEKDGALTDLPGSSYGNATYFISDVDEAGEPKGAPLEVYRGKGLDGEKMGTSDYIKVGDEVIVCGVLTMFGSTPEVTQGSKLMKLNDTVIEPKEPAQPGTPEGDGSKDNPFNVAAVINYVQELGADVTSSKEVYVKGVVKENTTTESTISQYGNMTFTMIDPGFEDVVFTAFQVYGLNGKKFTSVSDIKAGDDVIIYGNVVNYKGNTPETTGKGSAYVYSLNGKTGGDTPGPQDTAEPEGDGSLDNPFNVAAVINYVQGLGADVTSPNEVYVKGIVKENNTTKSTIDKYGNMNFNMIDKGFDDNVFQAYQVYGLEGQKFTSPNDIKVGDEVIVYGKVVNYKGNTPETTGKGSAYVYSINGITDPGDLPENPDTPEEPDNPSDGGISVNGTTVTLTNDAVTAGNTTTRIDLGAQGYENEKNMDGVSVSMSDGTVITFSKGSGSTTPKYYNGTKGVRMYPNNTVTIKSTGKDIAKVVLECDSYQGTDYVGNDTKTVSFNGDTVVLTNAHSVNSGGVQLRVKTISVTYAE